MTDDDTPPRADQPPGAPAFGAPLAHDRRWARDLRDAALSALALFVMLLVIDAIAQDLAPERTALWALLAALLFVVLLPPRVTAGEDWLAARGLLRTHRVRTGYLVSVRWLDGVSQRLVLRDMYGGRVELDPRVLIGNPDIWHLVAEGGRRSAERSLLTCGSTALRRLSRRVDSETAQVLFRVSGLE